MGFFGFHYGFHFEIQSSPFLLFPGVLLIKVYHSTLYIDVHRFCYFSKEVNFISYTLHESYDFVIGFKNGNFLCTQLVKLKDFEFFNGFLVFYYRKAMASMFSTSSLYGKAVPWITVGCLSVWNHLVRVILWLLNLSPIKPHH